MSKIRRVHRVIGVILVLPFLGWASTAVIFFLKPGYGPAYEGLAVKTYPIAGALSAMASLDNAKTFPLHEPWLETRRLRTILGSHLLVKTSSGWWHLRDDGSVWEPSEADVRALVNDAIEGNPRYGSLKSVDELRVETSTGVRIDLNWQGLSLNQYGRDTARIDWFYKVHYLQWTGNKRIDKVWGMIGLFLLVAMAVTGVWLLVKRSAQDRL